MQNEVWCIEGLSTPCMLLKVNADAIHAPIRSTLLASLCFTYTKKIHEFFFFQIYVDAIFCGSSVQSVTSQNVDLT